MAQDQTQALELTNIESHIFWALYYWLLENNQTPMIHVLVNKNVRLPQHLMGKESEYFNISPTACDKLTVEKDIIKFNARFSQKSFELLIPIENLICLFSREYHELAFNRPLIPIHFAMQAQSQQEDLIQQALQNGFIEKIEEPNTVKSNTENFGQLSLDTRNTDNQETQLDETKPLSNVVDFSSVRNSRNKNV